MSAATAENEVGTAYLNDETIILDIRDSEPRGAKSNGDRLKLKPWLNAQSDGASTKAGIVLVPSGGIAEGVGLESNQQTRAMNVLALNFERLEDAVPGLETLTIKNPFSKQIGSVHLLGSLLMVKARPPQ